MQVPILPTSTQGVTLESPGPDPTSLLQWVQKTSSYPTSSSDGPRSVPPSPWRWRQSNETLIIIEMVSRGKKKIRTTLRLPSWLGRCSYLVSVRLMSIVSFSSSRRRLLALLIFRIQNERVYAALFFGDNHRSTSPFWEAQCGRWWTCPRGACWLPWRSVLGPGECREEYDVVYSPWISLLRNRRLVLILTWQSVCVSGRQDGDFTKERARGTEPAQRIFSCFQIGHLELN
jgi:hypothetical protein